MRFFSPFETGIRFRSGWRWYWRFLLEHPNMIRTVEHDCYAAMGIVWC